MMSTMAPVIRTLRWFRLDTDALAGEEPIRAMDLDLIRRLFPNAGDPQRYLSYPVTASQKSGVQRYVEHQIDLDRFAYTVEADAVSTATPVRVRVT